MAIVDPRAAKLVTGRHWIEDDGAARLEAKEKGIVERRGDCYEFRGCGKIRSPGKIKYLRDTQEANPGKWVKNDHRHV